MKKVSLLIIALFISFTYFNENAINALASQYSKVEVMAGEIYKSGDVINIQQFVDECMYGTCKYKFIGSFNTEDREYISQESENAQFVFPQYDNKDVYWKIKSVEEPSYYNELRFYMEFFEYDKPELKISCNGNSLNVGESVNCELNLKYLYDVKNINFDLNTELFEISDFKTQENWNVDSINNNNYSLSNSEIRVEPLSDMPTSKIATFTLTATDVEKSTNLENNIIVNNIDYEDVILKDTIEADSATLNIIKKIEEPKKEEIKEEKKEEIIEEKQEEIVVQNPKEETENPPTGDKIPSFALIMLFIVIGVGLFIISKKCKLLIKL